MSEVAHLLNIYAVFVPSYQASLYPFPALYGAWRRMPANGNRQASDSILLHSSEPLLGCIDQKESFEQYLCTIIGKHGRLVSIGVKAAGRACGADAIRPYCWAMTPCTAV